MKNFKNFLKIYLKEELTDVQKKAVDKWNSLPKEKTNFTSNPFKNRDRIIIPFQEKNEENNKNNPTKDEIEKHLKNNNYSIKNYEEGVATDPHGRDTRIGKALRKTNASKELNDKFLNDLTRQNIKNSGLKKQIVISKHPYDICGMSTGRHWTSCLDMHDGVMKKLLPNELTNHSQIAYLTYKGDDEAKNPIARIVSKKFSSENHDIIRPDQKVYGTTSIKSHDNFLDHVNKWYSENYPTKENNIYHKTNGVYNDDNRFVHYDNKHPLNDTKSILNNNDHLVRRHAIEHEILTNDDINHVIKHENEPSNVLELIKKHKLDNKQQNDILDKHDSFVIQNHLADSEHASKEVLHRLINNGDERIKSSVLKNKNIDNSHIKALIDQRHATHELLNHPLLQNDDVNHMVKTNSQNSFGDSLLSNKKLSGKITSDTISSIYPDIKNNGYKKFLIANHKNTPKHILHELKTDNNDEIRKSAIKNLLNK